MRSFRNFASDEAPRALDFAVILLFDSSAQAQDPAISLERETADPKKFAIILRNNAPGAATGAPSPQLAPWLVLEGFLPHEERRLMIYPREVGRDAVPPPG